MPDVRVEQRNLERGRHRESKRYTETPREYACVSMYVSEDTVCERECTHARAGHTLKEWYIERGRPR